MKISVLIYLIVFCQLSFAQTTPTGIFQSHADVGHPKNKGSALYNDATQTYTVMGSGYNIWFNRDEFQYLYSKMTGDFTLTANFEFIGNKGNNHRKYGWMIRESLDDAAAHVSAVAHGDGLIVMQWRTLRGAYMRDPQDEIFFSKKGAEVVQMERAGKRITMRVAHKGEPMQEVGSYDAMDMPDAVLAGLYVCSHDSTATEQVKIWNVRIDKPVAKDAKPEQHIESITIADGIRKTLTTPVDASRSTVKNTEKYRYQQGDNAGSIQLYRTNPVGSEKTQITFDEYSNMKPAVSPDGKWLAFVSFLYNKDANAPYKQAMIRLMPLTESVAPSVLCYFYASASDELIWSPDSKSLTFTSYTGK